MRVERTRSWRREKEGVSSLTEVSGTTRFLADNRNEKGGSRRPRFSDASDYCRERRWWAGNSGRLGKAETLGNQAGSSLRRRPNRNRMGRFPLGRLENERVSRTGFTRGRLGMTEICFTNTGSELVIGLEGSDRGSKTTARRGSGRGRDKTGGRLSRRGSLGCSGCEQAR